MIWEYFIIVFSILCILASGILLGIQLMESFDNVMTFYMLFWFIFGLLFLFSIPSIVKDKAKEKYLNTKTCSVCEYETTDEDTVYCPYDGSKLLTNTKG